jgi:Domain of unknown function (DUF4465)/Secretion system C-terminal sorting domain
MKKIILFCSVFLAAFLTRAQTVSTFDTLPLGVDTFWNGSNWAGGFNDGEGYFVNSFDTATYGGVLYSFWNGFAYSNMTGAPGVTSDTDLTHAIQYSAVTGSGYGGSGNYAIGYDEGNTKIYLTGNGKGGVVNGFYATNTTYAYLSMRYGDQFEPAFSYTNKDSFVLNITGWYNGAPVADTVHFFLADFRDSSLVATDTIITKADTVIAGGDTTIYPADTTIFVGDTIISPGILKTWQWVDLHSLGNVDSLIFSFSSSQNGQYGINTPTYFAMDNFTTADMVDDYITINYEQDTLIGIWPFLKDSAALTPPYTISVISGPYVSGASATVIHDSIWYLPSIGIVTVDTLTYAVCGSNSQCVTAQIFINITGIAGIENLSPNAAAANVYPNPFSNTFKVSYTGNLKELRLYDVQGKLLKRVAGGLQAGETEIDAAELAAGPYIARIITDEGATTARIIKQ